MTTQQTYNQEEVQELFDVVFKLSAKDISDKLTKVRNRPEIAKRRWFWELLQNAKDSVTKTETVDVRLLISTNENGKHFVAFSHNGNPFKYQDAKNLIFPYSDKDEEEDSDKSGRFGTGFLATHILSQKIHVKGVYQKDSKSFDFKFVLDRSADSKTELAESISKTWQSFRDNRIENPDYQYDKSHYDTHFIYPLNEDMVQLTLESIEDFQISLPFALTFIPKINSITIEDRLNNEKVKYSVCKEKSKNISENINKTVIIKEVNDSYSFSEIPIISCNNDKIEIAIEVIGTENNDATIKKLQEKQPVLFCSFPLIGADEFPFPVVVNSENFVPKEERNGIWLGNTKEGIENQKLFEESIVLFETLVDYVSINNWKSCYNLFRTFKEEPNFPDLDSNWFKEKIQEPLKDFLLSKPLICNLEGEIKTAKEINFPYHVNKEVREKLWLLLKTYNKAKVTQKNEIHAWYEVIWKGTNRISIEVLLKFISGKNNIEELKKSFSDDKDSCLIWLNDTVELVSKNESSLLNENETKVLPNQFGIFKRKDELYLDDDTIDETLKKIFATIGNFKQGIVDWREELLEKKIYLDLPKNKTRGIEDISIIIVEHVKELLRKDSPSNDLQDLFGNLLNWLSDNTDLRDKYFKGLKTDTLLYKTTNETKLKQFTEILRKDRDGEISIDDLVNIDSRILALLNDPDLELKVRLGEQALEEMLREKQEFEFKKRTGDIFEKLFQQIINSDERFEIQKVEGEEDFIITRKDDSKQYYIELKSIRQEDQKVQVTHRQAKKAHKYPSNYFLCFIPNNGTLIDESYFRNRACFDGNIGIKLSDKVNKALKFEEAENGISVEFEDALLQQYKKYRYKFLIESNKLEQDNIDTFKQRMLK